MVELKLIGMGLMISVPAYMVVFRILVEKIRSREQGYWTSIGSPAPSDPKGQIVLLRELLISPASRMPADVYRAYRVYISAVRLLGLISFVLMAMSIVIGWQS